MQKKMIIAFLSILLLLSLAGCGVQEKVNEKISEKVAEGIMEKAGGEDVDVDLDGDQVTFKDKEGKKLTVGEGKWPEAGAVDLLPELKKGQIVSAVNSDEACVILLKGIEKKDFQQYVEKLKARGFTKEAAEYTNESGQGYNALLNEKTAVFVSYETQNKELSINLQINK